MNKKSLFTLVLGLFAIQLMIPNYKANENVQPKVESRIAGYAIENPTKEQVAAAEPTDIVKIADPIIENQIAMLVSKPQGQITVEDMKNVAFLTSTSGISSLSGLEYAINLSYMDISTGQISDLSPLRNLTSLQTVAIGNNEISDLTPLSNLPNLSSLFVPGNKITDISPLSKITTIDSLMIDNNEISDLSPLSTLKNLRNLTMDNTKVEDISVLSNMQNLSYLSAANNQISNISALSTNTQLNDIDLSNNQISDISSLSKATNINRLNLSNNKISDLSTISEFTKITYLNVSNNQISNISTLPSNSRLFANVQNQQINAADLTVFNEDEIIYNIIGKDGEAIPVNMGVPVYGANLLSNNVSFNVSNGFTINYSAAVSQNVTLADKFWIDEATTPLGRVLTDQELMNLFDVIDGATTFVVNQSAVDYNTPGSYLVEFVANTYKITTTIIIDEFATIPDTTPEVIPEVVPEVDPELNVEEQTKDNSKVETTTENSTANETTTENSIASETTTSEVDTIAMTADDKELSSTGNKENIIIVVLSILVIGLVGLKKANVRKN